MDLSKDKTQMPNTDLSVQLWLEKCRIYKNDMGARKEREERENEVKLGKKSRKRYKAHCKGDLLNS